MLDRQQADEKNSQRNGALGGSRAAALLFGIITGFYSALSDGRAPVH